MNQQAKTLNVTKLNSAPVINAEWEKSPWNAINSQKITFHMGNKPNLLPQAEFKIGYDNEAIYLIYKVKECNTRAIAKGYHSPVWEDSCVEFFFAPSGDISQGYFNVEINCGGTLLIRYQTKPNTNISPLSNEKCDQITIAATLPEIVDPEIKEENEWTLEYRLPYSVLQGFCDFVKPAAGVTWPANFYKCAEGNSTPHWLSWSPLKFPTPNFHLPEQFGSITFE